MSAQSGGKLSNGAPLHWLKALLKSYPPAWFAIREVYHALLHRREPELGLLRYLVDPRRSAVDVGANVGAYTHRLIPLCRETIAVEANPRLAADLVKLFGRKVRVINAAASDREGDVMLRIPDVGSTSSGLATIEQENVLRGGHETTVPTRTIKLADLDINDVGFIKIDVEGHEYAVIRGALPLIERCRPTILVEAEARHRRNAVASIRDLLEPLRYHGFMLVNGRTITSIVAFREDIHQSLSDADYRSLDQGHPPVNYVSNFIFIPELPVHEYADVEK